MQTVVTALWTVIFCFSLARGQDSKAVSQLATYTGKDREERLLEGAKKEGKVVWYTTLAGASYGAMLKAFEAKYPGISVDVYRADAYALGTKIIEEAGAGLHRVDVVETSPGTLLRPYEAGLLQPFKSPRLDQFPDDVKKKAPGGSVYWVSCRESYVGFAYNKKEIPTSDVPKHFEDLLNPTLRDKLGITIDSTGAKWMGAVSKAKGDKFVRTFIKKLGDQHVRFFQMSGRALLDVLIAGEIGASPVIFRNHALQAISKKAPVEWRPLDLVPTNAGSPALAARASHPHAALLFIDFILSPDGQKIFAKYNYGSPTQDYGFKRWYAEEDLSLSEYEKKHDEWLRLLRSIPHS
jgi:iron(III) transport system substrate-binding protein